MCFDGEQFVFQRCIPCLYIFNIFALCDLYPLEFNFDIMNLLKFVLKVLICRAIAKALLVSTDFLACSQLNEREFRLDVLGQAFDWLHLHSRLHSPGHATYVVNGSWQRNHDENDNKNVIKQKQFTNIWLV